MRKDLEILLNMNIQDIIKSPEYSMSLLKIYSVLYLGGGQPRRCSNSQMKYYTELKKNGMDKVNKKHILSFEGRRYIPGIFKDGKFIGGHLHIDSKYLTDAKALELLKNGWLTEIDFKILPDGYEPKKEIKKEVKKEPVKIEKKADKKEYLFDEIKAALKKGDYHELNKVANSLGLAKGKLKTKKAKELIENYILTKELSE